MQCASCGFSYGENQSSFCPHREGPLSGAVPHDQPTTLMSPVSTLRLLIRDRGHDPANFLVWEQGNHLMVAVRPEAGAVEIELPDDLNGWKVTRASLPNE
jgi:hypothetical protein